MKKSELKKLIKEEIKRSSPLNRKFGEPLPTLATMIDYHSTKKKPVIKESTGEYFAMTIGNLYESLESIEQSSSVKPNELVILKRSIQILEKTFKKVLKGKGLIGW